MNHEIQQTRVFALWLLNVRDLRARIAIARRIDRVITGNLGDFKSVGDGVSELRIDVGAGYRVYFTLRGGSIVIWPGVTSPHSLPISARQKKWQRRYSMTTTLLPFDMAELLNTDEAITEYLTQVLAEGDTDELIRAVGYVAKARGMAQIASDTGLGRASLYKAFAPGAKPRFETVIKVMHSLGIDLQATAQRSKTRKSMPTTR